MPTPSSILENALLHALVRFHILLSFSFLNTSIFRRFQLPFQNENPIKSQEHEPKFCFKDFAILPFVD